MGIRILVAWCGIFAFWHFVINKSFPELSLRPSTNYDALMGSDPVGVDAIPDEPTALIVSDHKGLSRWTVSIPQNHSFPLRSWYYEDICKQGETLRASLVQESRFARAKDWRRKDSYSSADHTFLEPELAASVGALPSTNHKHPGKVCERSLTFSLDTDDASFGKSLLMLWLSYGIAKIEDRAFFIDDTRWPYGQYTTYFPPPPSPGCVQPQPQYIVPCPHSAKHLLVSAATAPWTFGSLFEKEFLQARKHGVDKSRRIYDLMRTGYMDLFRMVGEDALYAASRIARFKEEAHQHAGSVVGMQIRRGDLRPLEYQYSQDYLPLERYSSAARRMLRSQLRSSLPETHTDVDDFHAFLEYVHSPLLLASDDPEMFTSTELMEAASPFEIQHAQERIQLATKATLDLASPAVDLREPGSAYVKHVDENSGWEGGFYSSLFFSLGRPRNRSGGSTLERLSQLPTAGDEDDDPSSEQTIRMRELVGRAYLLDMTVLGESDGVVCGVSSATCRVLGVVMGWDAVEDGRWMNVDDGRAWSWDGRR